MKILLPLALMAVACEAMAQDAQCVRERAAMVETIRDYARLEAGVLGPQGISERVLEAMGQTERHRFIPEHSCSVAYMDAPVVIGHGPRSRTPERRPFPRGLRLARSLGVSTPRLPFARPMTPRPVQHGGRVELDPCSSRPEPPSVLRVRANCGGRPFTAKLAVVMHYLAHELLNHLLANGAVLTPTTHTGSTVPRFYSSDDPPLCRVRATHREDLLSPRSLRLARKSRRR